jgi:hypothetical protein
VWSVALALVLTAWLLPADLATARVVATVHPPGAELDDQGPSLERGVVTWMTTTCETCEGVDDWDVDYRVHARYPDGRRAVLARGVYGFFGSGPEYEGEDVDFFASSTHLAIERDLFGSGEFEGDYSGVTLSAGAFGERPARLLRCRLDWDPVTPATTVSGATLAYDSTPCSDTSTLTVRNLSTGERWALPQSGRWIRALAVEGRYLAMATTSQRDSYEATHVTLLDLDRREPAYERTLPSAPSPNFFDVGPDGSLAVRIRDGAEEL